ncbi:MAG TPA: oligoendopeptidase F [Thermoanaerobaculia bacterium]|jgi:oligoendopeptidase F|nr:oligoendopeptidase F [Thermoanaerobaculia bacterium]
MDRLEPLRFPELAGPAAATAVEAEAPPRSRLRDDVDPRYRWDLRPIFASWEEWERACDELGELVDRLGRLQGTLSQGAPALLAVLRLQDELGQLAHRVWYYPSLTYDQDQRDNSINAKRQRVQVLFARWEQAGAWFKPEVLQVPLDTVRAWMDSDAGLALYRFKLEDLYRRQEHVLGEEGERVLSFTSRFADLPDEAYSALSTADIRYPSVRLSDGREITVSYGQYRTLLATHRVQRDRAATFAAFYETFEKSLNTYAALYNGVCQRDWFGAMARRYKTTLEGALDGNRIPTEVVERLIETTRAGVAPLQRYHRLRRRVLGPEVSGYHLYDTSIPLLEGEKRYPYDEAVRWVIDSASPLGADYQRRVRAVFDGRYVDVYENEGKRSGAYSAGVYGVHPYMLLNYNDTLDDLFTLAHETGHTLHSLLSHESQPFTYASYTIFVAEVASTLSEALLLDALLASSDDPRERALLLQHAIDSITGTFYTQVLFAEWELEAHRAAERGEPITGETLSERYFALLQHYYGDSIELDPLYRITWARIPHFFQSPYYVYQYATSFAASAQIAQALRGAADATAREAVVQRYLRLLRAGGNDYPIDQLLAAGVDLARPEPVEAVVAELDRLVGQLEGELAALG